MNKSFLTKTGNIKKFSYFAFKNENTCLKIRIYFREHIPNITKIIYFENKIPLLVGLYVNDAIEDYEWLIWELNQRFDAHFKSKETIQ